MRLYLWTGFREQARSLQPAQGRQAVPRPATVDQHQSATLHDEPLIPDAHIGGKTKSRTPIGVRLFFRSNYFLAFWYVAISSPESTTCPFIARSRSALAGPDKPVSSVSSA